jgi:hypothetical protein
MLVDSLLVNNTIVELTGCDGFLKVFNCTLLALEAIALLVVEPAQLLENFGMAWVAFQNSLVCCLGTIILQGQR